MTFKQKAGYMLIGCLFTIVGYILAIIGGGFTHAQQNEQVIDKIICKSLEVVNAEGTTVVTIQETGLKGGRMDICDRNGKVITRIMSNLSTGQFFTYDKNGKIRIGITESSLGGSIYIKNKNGKEVVGIGTDEHGGHIIIENKNGNAVVGIGANEHGNGDIQSYKGSWKSH